MLRPEAGEQSSQVPRLDRAELLAACAYPKRHPRSAMVVWPESEDEPKLFWSVMTLGEMAILHARLSSHMLQSGVVGHFSTQRCHEFQVLCIYNFKESTNFGWI